MKYISSNQTVKSSLDILSKIQKVQTPDGLYSMLMARIEQTKRDVVPMYWVKIAAAVILFLLLADIGFIVGSSQDSENTLAELVSTESYFLYNE